MNELFNELITEIMSLGEAKKKPATTSAAKKKPDVKRRPDGSIIKQGESPTHPGYYSLGNVYYSNVKKGGQATHKTVDGNIVALTEPEKARLHRQADKRGTDDYGKDIPVAQPRDVTPQKATTQEPVNVVQTIADFETNIRSRNPRNRGIAEELLKLIKSGDVREIEAFMTKFGIQISGSNRLKSTKNADGTKALKDTGKGSGLAEPELSKQLVAALETMGVDIIRSKNAGAEEFKPVKALSKVASENKVNVTVTETGINVAGIEITRIDDTQASRFEEALVKQAQKYLTERDKKVTPEYTDRLRFYIQSRIRATNNNIDYLQRASGGVYQFQGDEGGKKLQLALNELIDQHVPEATRQVATDAIEAMRIAKNPGEFNEAWAKLVEATRNTAVEANLKSVTEMITALRVVALGGIALVPVSETFELADVIALRRSPITGEVDIQLLLADVEEETEITVAGSVKFKDGAASVNAGKIENSRFNTGTVDRVNCSGVVQDLKYMNDKDIKDKIFSGEPTDAPTEEAKQQVMGYIQKYGPMVKDYFGFPEDMSEEDLYESLSYGRVLQCGPDGPQRPSDGKPFKEGQEGQPYSGQWRLWAVLGQVNEAIHNRTVEEQYYHTLRYDTDPPVIIVADGIRTLSKMKVQATKNKTAKGAFQGRTKAFTIPAKIDEVRDGNPCSQTSPTSAPKKRQGKTQ